MTDHKIGDRVRVTFEGTIEHIEKDNFGPELVIKASEGSPSHFIHPDFATVEKIQRPFKPGDVVRSNVSGRLFFVGEGRHFDPNDGNWYDWELSRNLYELVE